MPKKRIYEIAKELNVESKKLLEKLKELNIDAKSHTSSISETDEEKVRALYGNIKDKSAGVADVTEKSNARRESRPSKTETAEIPKGVVAKAQNGDNGQKQSPINNKDVREQRPVADKGLQGQRPQNGTGQRPQTGTGQRPQTGTGQRPQTGTGQRPQNGTGQRPQNGTGQRPQNGTGQRPQTGTGQRPQNGTGQRPQTGTGQRPQTGTGQRPQTGTGQRPQTGTGQRPQTGTGQRPQTGTGQRPQTGYGGGQRPGNTQRPARQKTGEAQAQQTQNNPGKPVQKFQNQFQNNKHKKPQNNRNFNTNNGLNATKPKPEEPEIKLIQLPQFITVKELTEKMGKKTSDILKVLMKDGLMLTINQQIDFEMASKIAEKFDILVEEAEEVDILEEAFREDDDGDDKDIKERPPVVVVMGHVDHGKTSLLDAIKKSKVTEKEAGGITQHIGAYTVSIDNKPITFLDTPGHEAFTAMRMRGAQVTDIAILVVAADDGVMPQTIEAINHAKAANVEIIVAINKIDKPSANPDRVKQELVEYGLVSEDWGGETICVPVSAIKKTGLDQLLEMIILVAEMKELKANPNKSARGTVIEAELDKGRGPIATVLIQQGTLKVGDSVVAGSTYGKVRVMIDDKGKKLKKAGPSKPVEIVGLSEVPQAGDMFYAAKNERHARQVSESVVAHGREMLIHTTTQKVSLDDLFDQIQSGNVKDLNIIVKADVQGSVEAVKTSLERLSNDEVRIRTIHGGVGAVNETDVMLASASNAIIIGFNVRPEAQAKSVADEQKVDIRLYRVIYNAIEDITAAMKGMLEPVYEEKVIGHAEIRQLFKASGVGTIGGSYITDGKFIRSAKVRIMRNGIVVYDGELTTLRRFKDDVKEVNSGYECGLLFNKYNDIKEGDIVEAYVMQEIPQ